MEVLFFNVSVPHRNYAPVAAYSQEDANNSEAVGFTGSFNEALIFGVPVHQMELETTT